MIGINFQGPGPDKITFVTAAYELGFCIVSKENGKIFIEIFVQNAETENKKNTLIIANSIKK